MIPQPPPGQGPIDPRGAFTPPGTPPGAAVPPSLQPTPMQNNPTPGPGPMPGSMPGPIPGPMPYPPIMMMPPMPYPPPPPPRRGGVGRAILMTMLALFLLVSVLLNVALLGLGAGDASNIIQETTRTGKADQKIAVVPLKGIIDPNTAAQFDRFLTLAEKDKNVKALVVEIDSPGGTVTASDEIFDRIKRFKSKKSVPVIVSMASLATSGGYYAACGADHIIAQPTTFTGNIGVLMPRYNFYKLMEKYGVEETTIVSSGAPFKNAGSSFRPETPEEKAYMQQLADAAFVKFKSVVKTGRGTNLKGSIDEIANGKVYTAEEAKNLGLIDQVGYLHDAQDLARERANLGDPTVVAYEERKPSLISVNLAGNRTGAAGAGTWGGPVNVPVNVNIDPNFLHELMTPRPMYLWRGQ